MRLWKNAAKMRLALFALCAGALVASVTGSAWAQAPTLTAGGPWVMPDFMGNPSVAAGRSITWSLTGNNLQPAPVTARVTSEPQNPECDPGGFNTEYSVFGGENESAPQQYLSFVDNNADGDCHDPGESVVEDMGAPTDCLMMAPSGQQRIQFNDITVAAFGAFNLQWITNVSPMAAPPDRLCSWAHIVNASTGALIQSTRVPGAGMAPPACTCVTISPPTGIDASVTKTGTPDALPLVAGDPGATITYTITVTNIGSQDLMGGTLNDTFTPDNLLEWVEVLTCDPPLVCSDVTADPTTLTVTGWMLDPLEGDGTCLPGNTCTQQVVVRALVTCAAATDDDSGVVCNQGEFSLGMATFPTDDPDTPLFGDATCTPVVFSNLTESTKSFVDYVDGNGNGQLDAGETVNFEITAFNAGRATARDVIVSDDLGAAGCWRPGTINASASGGVVTGEAIEWQIGDLSPGESQVLAFSVVLDADMLCCNQASLESEERRSCGLNAGILTDDPSTGTVDDATCASPGPQPVLVIEKTWCVDPTPPGGCPGTAAVGNQIAYTITITNNGTGVATGAELRDDFNMFPCNTGFTGEAGLTVTTTDGMDWGDASTSRNDSGGFPRDFGEIIITDLGGANGIQPGETITVDWVNVNRSFVDGCCNQAFVTYAEASEAQPSDDPTTIGRRDDPTCLNAAAVTEGELEKRATLLDVAGGAPDGFISIGDQVRYRFAFTNVGSEIMTNVSITDRPPSCAMLDSASVVLVQDDSGSFVDSSAGGNLDVSIGSISPAETVIFTVTATITEVITGCCNQAVWTSDQAVDGGEGLSDRNLADFAPEQETCFDSVNIPMAMLSWVKGSDAVAGCNAPGTTVNYTLTVTNNGTAAVDTWDIVDDVAPFGGCANVTPTAPLTCDAVTGTLVVDSTTEGPIDAMGGTQSFRYSVRLPCDAAGGTENPPGDFNYDDGSGGTITLSDTATAVTWGWPDLSTSGKRFNWDAGDMDGDGRMAPGAENAFSYTVTLMNSGSCVATGVTLSDTYPTSFVITDPGTGIDDGTTITWNVGSIPAGGMMMFTFTAMIDEANPPPGGNIRNDFSVDATNATAGTCVLPSPDITDRIESTAGVPWGTAAGAELLRNAVVSCRGEAMSVYDSIFSRAEPQIDATAAATTATPAPASPIVFAGDSDTGASNESCPQVDPNGAALDNRVLIFYEYTGDPLTRISVAKNGTDVEVSW